MSVRAAPAWAAERKERAEDWVTGLVGGRAGGAGKETPSELSAWSLRPQSGPDGDTLDLRVRQSWI